MSVGGDQIQKADAALLERKRGDAKTSNRFRWSTIILIPKRLAVLPPVVFETWKGTF